MMTIQARELEALQAKICEAEARLREKDARVGSLAGSHGRVMPNEENRRLGDDDDDGGDDVEEEEGEENTPDYSSPSSSISGRRPSDEGFTDSSTTSAATSNDLGGVGSEGEHGRKTQDRKS
jgi:hypothetical protein